MMSTSSNNQIPALRNYPIPDYHYITDGATLAQELEFIQTAERLGIDCETTGLDPLVDDLRLIQIAAPHHPVLLVDLPCIKERDRLPLKRLLSSSALKLSHNLKFEWQFLNQAGLELSGPYFDTQLAFRVLTAGLSVKLSLQAVARRLLQVKLDKTQQYSNFARSQLREKQLIYAAIDAAILLDLHPLLLRQLKQQELQPVAHLSFRCIPATAQMELNGIRLDLERWQAYHACLMREQRLALAQIHQLRRTDKPQLSLLPELTDTINPNSPQQLLGALQAIGVPVQSTNEKSLKPYAAKFPIIRALLKYRELSKITSTFNSTLASQVHPLTERLHPNWRQYGARSGRYTCKNPSIQVIPRTPQARRCFVATPGYCLVKIDYSQIELRIVAKLSGDARLNRAYRLGQDVHRLTASMVTGKPLEAITDEERKIAKETNFGVIYGISSTRLRTEVETKYEQAMSLEEAASFIQGFFRTYPGIKRWQDAMRYQVYAKGVRESRTLLGRRRRWKEKPKFTEVLNHPVQGSCADMIDLAIAKLLQTQILATTGSKLIGIIHDEIVLECPIALVDQVSSILKQCMMWAGTKLLAPVPVAVDVTISESWGG